MSMAVSTVAPAAVLAPTRDSLEPAPGDERARLRVVVINGSPNQPSKTMGLVGVVLDSLASRLRIETSQVDVYHLGPGFTGAIEREDVTAEVEQELRRGEAADILIAATPVFRGSYTAMFKHYFDLIDQYALANKPVVLAATAGSEKHTLVLEHALRPLFGFFQAMTVPVAFFASAGDFDGTVLLNPRVYTRIQVGVDDIAGWLRAGAPASPPASGEGGAGDDQQPKG